MVSLLSCLFGLARFWQTMYPGHVNCSSKPLCPPEDFENASLTSKCWRQLQVKIIQIWLKTSVMKNEFYTQM